MPNEVDSSLLRDPRIGFDLDPPGRIEECGDDDHGGGWANLSEEAAMNMADSLPIFGASQVHAGAIHVLHGTACVLESCGDEIEASLGLLRYIRRIRTDGASARDMDLVADANSAGEADDRFEGRSAGNVFARHIFAWNILFEVLPQPLYRADFYDGSKRPPCYVVRVGSICDRLRSFSRSLAFSSSSLASF